MPERNYDALRAQVEESIRKSHFKPSRQLKDVMGALKDVCSLRGEAVGDNAQQMIQAHERLGKACEAYTASRQNARTDKGKNRLDIVGAIYSLQQQEREGINALRSPRAQRENQGKTWGNVIASQREKTIDITNQQVNTVGGGSSTRYVVEIDGKTGYFSEHQTLKTKSEYMKSCAEKAVHPEVREGFLRAAETADLTNETVDLLASTASNHLEDNNSDFAESMKQYIEYKDSAAIREILGYDHYSAEAKTEFCESLRGVGKQYTANSTMNEDAKIMIGANISNRNIATSRLAELLGQENLIANSQRLCIKNGENILHGVVMDQAVGKDIRSSDPADQEELRQIADFSDPNFQRQITNLEIIDILSGQVDRNPGNMFYQLGDTEDGKKRITGIQGIDNDAAFGLMDQAIIPLNKITMIDAGLSENLMGIDRNVLDYTFGDILSPEEIQALDNRMTQVKDHVLNNNVKIMNPDEWTKETAQQIDGAKRYVDNIKHTVNNLNIKAELDKSTMEQNTKGPNETTSKKDGDEKDEAKNPQKTSDEKPKEMREVEKFEETATEKNEPEKLNEKVSEKELTEKAGTPEKERETQKPEKHERKEIPLNEFENMVKNSEKDKAAPQASQTWEHRYPSVPFNAGRRLQGELGIGQHHRTKGGPSR